MVATRATSKGSQGDTPKKHATASGRVEKPKKATKAKNKPGPPMKAADLMFEAKLMKQVGLGEVSLHESRRRLQS